jgi:hypothetical protein
MTWSPEQTPTSATTSWTTKRSLSGYGLAQFRLWAASPSAGCTGRGRTTTGGFSTSQRQRSGWRLSTARSPELPRGMPEWLSMGTSIWTWIGLVTHFMRGGTSWQRFWSPQKQRASKPIAHHLRGTPTASTGFDSAREVADPATEVTIPAVEMTDSARELADTATEVANSAMEATDGTKEVTDLATVPTNSATVPTNQTHAVPTLHAWTTCTRVASRTRPRECWRTAPRITPRLLPRLRPEEPKKASSSSSNVPLKPSAGRLLKRH